jgi:alcohol dehydrogenase
VEAGFDFQPRTRIVFGAGCLATLGERVRELGARRVLLVTDPGLVAAGHAERGAAALRAAGCELVLYAEVRENPDALDVDSAARAARAAFPGGPECLVGLGGGSAIDVAKGAAMVLAGGGRMQDYRGFGKVPAPLLPLVAVPTTAGTGSEVQSYALVADEHTHAKMACGARDAAPRVALLDPELTLTMPRFVTACTGLDALGHALETAVSRKRTALSALYSRAAFRLVAPSFERVLARPDDREARAAMLLGACHAGMAIEQSMLGAAHSIANPLTARYGLEHGLAVAVALTEVVRFNAEDDVARARYAELAREARLATAQDDGECLVALLAYLERALAAAGVGGTLARHGADVRDAGLLAEEASRQWTAQFNPRPVGRAELERLIAAVLGA